MSYDNDPLLKYGRSLAGGFVVFRLTAGAEQGGLSAARVLKWTASLWVWPLFLLLRR